MRNIAEIIKDGRDSKQLSQTERQIALAYIQGKHDALKELKLDSNSNNWIPVSEQSPEKSGNYWCTFGGTNLTGSDYYTTESDAKEIFDEPEEYAGWRSQNVIAWMPLPPSYKIESE